VILEFDKWGSRLKKGRNYLVGSKVPLFFYGRSYSMKNFWIGILGSVFLTVALESVKAQSPTSVASPSSAPEAKREAPSTSGLGWSFGASVWTGARSDLQALLAGGNDSHTIGPFVRPLIDLGYNAGKFNFHLGYEFAVSGAQGFGSSNNHKDFGDNFYTFHDPNLNLTAKLNDRWNTNLFADLRFDSYNNKPNNKPGKNELKFEFSPDLEYKFSSEFSVALGYFFERDVFMDATAVSLSSFTEALSRAQDAAAPQQKQAATAAIDGARDPYFMLHSAIATAKWAITEGTNLKVAVRAGRYFTNFTDGAGINQGGYSTRLQSDLSTKVTKNFGLDLRYRLQNYILSDSSREMAYYNRGRVIATYALNSKWALKMEDQFTANQDTRPKKDANYENENYLGVRYSF